MVEAEYDFTYEDGEVYLSECLTSRWKIERTRFINCKLFGPVVVAVGEGCKWREGFNVVLSPSMRAESVVWPVTEDVMLGTVGMEHCRFDNCSWIGVGFVIANVTERQKVIDKLNIARMDIDLGMT